MKVCGWCGVEFTPGRGKLGKFCSNPCRLAALNALPRKRVVGFVGQRTAKGYVRGTVWDGDEKRVLMEHRWVMEQAIGRRLTLDEVVHHRNGIRHDNRLENLELYSGGHAAHLLHEHVPPRMKAAQLQRDRTRAMLLSGMRQREIAAALGISEASVSRYLGTFGLRSRADHRSTSP